MKRKGVFWELPNPNQDDDSENPNQDDSEEREEADAGADADRDVKHEDKREHAIDMDRIFQKFQGVGPVTVPVGEATDFMANLEHKKLTTTELRKQVTDLTYENKYWRAYALALLEWQEKAKEKLAEAKKRGEKEVTLPPLPRDIIIPMRGRSEGEGESDYMKDFAKFIGPYIAIGRYLRESESGSANSAAALAPITKYDAQGNHYEIPLQYASFFGITPGTFSQHNESSLSPLPPIVKYDEQGNKYEIPLLYASFFGITPESFSQKGAAKGTPDPFAMMPMIKKVEADGTTTFYPAWMYPQTQQPQPSPDNDRNTQALTELSTAITKLQEKINEYPTSSHLLNDQRQKLKEDLNFFKEMRDILAPTTPADQEARKKEAIELERIRQEEETKREKERTQQRAFDTWSKILSGSEEEGEAEKKKREKEIYEKGRAFINNMMKKAQELSSSQEG